MCFMIGENSGYLYTILEGEALKSIDELPMVRIFVGLNTELLTLLGLGGRMLWNYRDTLGIHGVIKFSCSLKAWPNMIIMILI